jgi:signal transduction histidine kinase
MSFNVLYPIGAPSTFPFLEPVLESKRADQPVFDTDDLESAFSLIRQEGQGEAQASFRIVREGRVHSMHPVIWYEAYRIGREALLNAFHHSEGSEVEVELEYAPSRLRLAVRDNGKGIAPGLFNSSGVGHRGLSDMRERAERMGAKFKLLSRTATGTEIELSIPGHVAFATHIQSRMSILAQA